MKIGIHIIFIFLCLSTCYAQDSLSLTEIFLQLREYHPLYKTALLQQTKGEAEIRIARGNFDPSIQFNYLDKTFDNSQYFQHQEAAIKIPTWMGIDIKTGITQNSGKFLNPEFNTPDEGLAFIEFSIPILRNLITDERRTALRNAQQYLQYAQAQRDEMLVELHFKVAQSFWDWYASYRLIKLYQSSFEVANERFTMVKNSYELGSYAAIDTTEADMEVQRQRVLLYEALVKFTKARYQLSAHLWNEDGSILMLSEEIVPKFETPYIEEALDYYVQKSDSLNPKIRKINWDIEILKTQKKLYTNLLLPQLSLDYKPLGYRENMYYDAENRSVGLSFYAPLFVRKERGKLALTEVKLLQQQQQFTFTKTWVQNEIIAAYNNYLQIQNMLDAQQKNARDALALRDAEQRKFSLGDANVFMINYRERYLLEARSKEITVEIKKLNALAELYAKTGIWPEY